jgi:2'-5' RNA ligase
MRLFVGIELPPVARSAIDAAVTRLGSRLARSSPGLDARWVESEKLHVTLWFLGEVTDDRLSSVMTALDRPFPTAAFPLRVAGFGAFPPSGPVRVIWMGIPQGGAELRSVNAEVSTRVVPLGFEPDRKVYTAHLTVARVRDPRSARGRALRDALDTESSDVPPFTVTAVTLFRSRLSPKGSQYEVLLRVPLS